MRKEIERETRQKYVRDAARRLLATKGIEHTSMEDIARAVEYTRRTLYAYFPSRDEICLQVFIDTLSARWDCQRAALAEAEIENGLTRILIWGESFFTYSKSNPFSLQLSVYFDLKGITRERINKETFERFEALNTELAEGLRALFRQGVEDRSLRDDLDVDLCISQYLYSLRSIVNRALSPGYSFVDFDSDEYVRHYLNLFARGIQNDGGRNR